jgi:Sulfocyanin (SoxE) domain
LPPWITFDSAGKKVTLSLETSAGVAGSSALINGYRAGGVRVMVPVGWTVQWNWRNADNGSPHSLVVMTQREKIPLEGGRPPFSNAMTRSVTDGLAPGQGDQSTFEAEEAGWYWLLCGVPNHALNGEWIELRVDPAAQKPEVVVKTPAPS